MATPQELRQHGKFYEFLHVSWGIIEFRADEGILKAYCLSSQDVRAKPLLDLNFGRKLSLFRNMGVISIEDYNIVCQFKTKRNNLFHTGGLYVSSLTNEEKEQIMDIGQKAIDIMENLSNLLSERQKGRYVYLQKEKRDNYDK
jgi:hypothetical protein